MKGKDKKIYTGKVFPQTRYEVQRMSRVNVTLEASIQKPVPKPHQKRQPFVCKTTSKGIQIEVHSPTQSAGLYPAPAERPYHLSNFDVFELDSFIREWLCV